MAGHGGRAVQPHAGGGEAATRALIERAQRGDAAAREQLVASHARLVWSIVARFHRSAAEREDLFQVGCVGLLKAVQRFDLRMPVQFSTYAVPLILGEIRRHFRDDGPLRVSRGLKALAARAQQVEERLARELGREPALAEVAAALGVPVDEVVAALESTRPVHSLEEAVHPGDSQSLSLGDQLADPAEREVAWLDRLMVREALARLDPRSRMVLQLRFFRGRTQMEVARLIGISQVQVSRIERKALAQVRAYLTGEAGR